MPQLSRRSALVSAAKGAALAPLAYRLFQPRQALAAGGISLPQPPAHTVAATHEPDLKLPPFKSSAEQQGGHPPLPLPLEQRVGFALVGLGNLTLDELLPAFGASCLAKPTALVTGNADKGRAVAGRYGIPAKSVYSYENFDDIKHNPEVQVVYIVLPNSMHKEYTLRSAAAGKHVLCEKPMAVSVLEAEAMIKACDDAQLKLMIAYRMQYEPYNTMIRQMVRQQVFGKAKLIEAINGQVQGDPNQWRQKKALSGGGCLPDVGIYCLNACRFISGEEPVQVFASTYSSPNDPRFKEVEDAVSFQLRFPSGLMANCSTSYDIHESRRLRVHAQGGWFGLDPAFSYRGLQMELSHAEGKLERRERPALTEVNQFAREIDHMADCVLRNLKPHTPGEEGLQDQKLIAAIYASAASGKPVKLAEVAKPDAFRGPAPFAS